MSLVFIVLAALIAATLSAAQVWAFRPGPARLALSWPRVALAWAASAWLAGLAVRLAYYMWGGRRQMTLTESLVAMAIIAAIAFAPAGAICRLTPFGRRPVRTVGALLFGTNCLVAGFLLLVVLTLFSLPPH